MKKIIPVILLILVLVAASSYFRKHIDEFKKLTQVSILDFVIISAFYILTGILNGLRIKIFINIFKIPLRFFEWYGLAMTTTLGNYLFFQSGLISRGIYLKKKHNFPYSTYLLVSACGPIIALFSVAGVGILATFLSFYVYKIFYPKILVLFLAILAIVLVVITFKPNIDVKNKHIKKIVEGWIYIKNKPRSLLLLVAVDIGILLSYAWRYYFCFRALNMEVPFLYCGFITPFVFASGLISLIPGGLGIKEASAGISTALIGMGLDKGILVATLDRCVAITWVFLLGTVFATVLYRDGILKKK